MYAPDHHLSRRSGHAGHAGRTAQHGLSLIEVLVGMVVALLVSVAAAGSASLFTATQRQGVGSGGALVNASTALNALRDDVAAAGLGFFGDSKYLCTKLNLSVGSTAVLDGAAFLPLNITNEATGADRIDVVYATQVASGANVLLDGPSNGTEAELRSLLPVTVTATSQPAVLLAPATPGDACTVRSVTSVVDSTVDDPQKLVFGNSGAYNKVGFTTPPAYVDKARVALLGDLRVVRYRRNGTDLQLERPLVSNTPVTLARNVIAFRAQYGIASGTSGVTATALASWQSASGAYAALSTTTLPRVRALRIGLVTRSAEKEKPNRNSGVCEASSALPRDPLDPTATVTPDVSDWQCYRYRTTIVVVPLRNLVMGTAS